MSDIWANVKSIFTHVEHNKVYVDNVVFRLHYKVTTILLVLFGILVTSRQYIGDPIDCIVNVQDVNKIIDAYCWSHGTFTVHKGKKNLITREDYNEYFKIEKEKKHPAPYLAREFWNVQSGDVDERVYHSYYQWVWCFLFFQAFLFYLPHWIWKTWEGGRMKTFVADLNSFIVADDEKHKHQDQVVDYFCHQGHGRWNFFCLRPQGNHTGYTLKYFLCEILNLVNICAQIIFLDILFDYKFSQFGLQLWGSVESDLYHPRNDFMTKLFPIVTLCEAPVYGFGASIQSVGAMCVLPINILNEKIFIFLWCWFLLILTITALGICYRVLTLCPSTAIRKWLILRLNHAIPEHVVDSLCRQLDFGDWYFLYLLGKNMNPIYYSELLERLANRFNGSSTPQTLPPWSNQTSFTKHPLDTV